MKNCRNCQETKPLELFAYQPRSGDGRSSVCKPCVVIRNREYWRTPKGRMSYVYNSQCAASKARGHPAPAYSREALTAWAFTQGLEALVTSWAAAGYPKDLAPSVDRLDDAQGYSFANIQLVRWCDNNEKMYVNRKSGVRITAQNRRVEQLTSEGIHVAYFPSIAMAARETGNVRPNINAMCKGHPQYKSVGGYVWRYALP